MIVGVFLRSVNQSIETGIEEIRVQVAEPLIDGFLNFGIGSEMATCRVLLQWSEDTKITWCEIRTVGRPDLWSSRTYVCLVQIPSIKITPVFVT
ncbi:hypothetical protein AVEN_29435-1 [Araneus ventricosus]|uniref:Uncharacterized protein n=1 Tax=Araneus ventricosus TaxID=182803 RepID=A0A4Y2D0T7_ARAVE|nr:hypothetical protein AVEN_29435-1 [Araneus ventricosus]